MKEGRIWVVEGKFTDGWFTLPKLGLVERASAFDTREEAREAARGFRKAGDNVRVRSYIREFEMQ